MGEEFGDTEVKREEDRAMELISEINVATANISRRLKIVLNEKKANAGDNQSEDCELNRALADALNGLQTLLATIAL